MENESRWQCGQVAAQANGQEARRKVATAQCEPRKQAGTWDCFPAPFSSTRSKFNSVWNKWRTQDAAHVSEFPWWSQITCFNLANPNRSRAKIVKLSLRACFAKMGKLWIGTLKSEPKRLQQQRTATECYRHGRLQRKIRCLDAHDWYVVLSDVCFNLKSLEELANRVGGSLTKPLARVDLA